MVIIMTTGHNYDLIGNPVYVMKVESQSVNAVERYTFNVGYSMSF